MNKFFRITGLTFTGVALAAAAPVTFHKDVLPVLQQHCTSARGCHGDDPTDSVMLDLRPVAAYRELVGKTAQARKTALRVQRGAPESSFLVDKLTGSLGAGEGKRRRDFEPAWIQAGR